MFVAFDSELLSRGPAISVEGGLGTVRATEVPLRLKQGQFLFHQGDAARSIYRVTEGVLRLSRVTERGRQQVIAFGYPGDIIGLPVRGARTTDCEALTQARVSVLPARMPEETSGAAADVAFLAAAALWEIAAMQEHLMTLGHKSSRERVASFLLVLMRRVGIREADGIHLDLPMCRADIAEFLGLRTETVSRAFTDLRQSGVIELASAHRVTVLDARALEEIAEGD